MTINQMVLFSLYHRPLCKGSPYLRICDENYKKLSVPRAACPAACPRLPVPSSRMRSSRACRGSRGARMGAAHKTGSPFVAPAVLLALVAPASSSGSTPPPRPHGEVEVGIGAMLSRGRTGRQRTANECSLKGMIRLSPSRALHTRQQISSWDEGPS